MSATVLGVGIQWWTKAQSLCSRTSYSWTEFKVETRRMGEVIWKGRFVMITSISDSSTWFSSWGYVLCPIYPNCSNYCPKTNSLVLFEKYFNSIPIHKALAHLFTFIHSSYLKWLSTAPACFSTFFFKLLKVPKPRFCFNHSVLPNNQSPHNLLSSQNPFCM